MGKIQKNQGQEFWAHHIQCQAHSEKSCRQYCHDEGISYWTFRNWMKRFKNGSRLGKEMVALPREIYQGAKIAEPFIDLVFSGTITIRVARGFDRELLHDLIRELEARS